MYKRCFKVEQRLRACWLPKALFYRSTTQKRQNFYEVLEVTPNATQSQIKAAYYRLSMKHHPDKVDSSDNKFQQLTEAYETLGNVHARKTYNRGLFVRGPGRQDPNIEEIDSLINPKRRQPTHLGRTEKYNFDEFYKMHYPETLARRRNAKSEYEMYEKMKSERGITDRKKISFDEVAGILIIALLIIIGIPAYVLDHSHDSPPKKNK